MQVYPFDLLRCLEGCSLSRVEIFPLSTEEVNFVSLMFCLCFLVAEARWKAAFIQGVPGGKVNILGGHGIGHSKQNTLYEHVSYSERFPR
jgi:hypothetical protein